MFLPALTGGAVTALFALYCLSNGSGHSGFEPMAQLPFHGLVAAAGLALWFLRARLPAVLAVVMGVLGAGFVVYVDALSIMRGYEQWLAAGMPDRHPQAGPLVALYGAIVVVILWVAWMGATRFDE